MTDYPTFCERYGYNPDSPEGREAYREAKANLAALHSAAAGAETREAIERAQSSSREG